MDTQKSAFAAANALGQAAAASLDRRAKGAGLIFVNPPIPAYVRQAFDGPVAKYLAAAKPHFALDGPLHPALDPKNALVTGEK